MTPADNSVPGLRGANTFARSHGHRPRSLRRVLVEYAWALSRPEDHRFTGGGHGFSADATAALSEVEQELGTTVIVNENAALHPESFDVAPVRLVEEDLRTRKTRKPAR